MSPVVTVTVMLMLPWIMLGEPLTNNHRRYSVVSPSIFTPVKLSMEIPHPVDQIYRRSQEVDDIGTTHPIDNKYGSNQNEIYKYDNFSMHTKLLELKKNASTDIQYSIHDVIHNDLEEIKNQTEENGWTLAFRPEQALISKLTSSNMSKSISDLSRPTLKIGVLSPPSKFPDNMLEPSDRQDKFPGLNHYRIPGVLDYYAPGPIVFAGLPPSELVLDGQPASQPAAQPASQPPAQPAPQPPAQPAPQPPAQPSSSPAVIDEEPIIITPESPNILNEQIPVPSSQPQMTVMNKIHWQRVGILLALIQLVLFKLKLVGFIKVLLFFLFKLKLLSILVFFKFISIFNILLFYKLFVLPLLLLPLLPIILSLISPTFMVGLLSIPKNMINMVLGTAYFGNTTSASTSTTETISYTSPITNPLDSVKISSMPHNVTKTLSLFKILSKNDFAPT